MSVGNTKKFFFSYFISEIRNFSHMRFFRKCSMFRQSIPLNPYLLSYSILSSPLCHTQLNALDISRNTLLTSSSGMGIKGGVYFMGKWDELIHTRITRPGWLGLSKSLSVKYSKIALNMVFSKSLPQNSKRVTGQ